MGGRRARGTPLPQTPGEWIAESVDRAGMLGWINDLDRVLNKGTGGVVSWRRLIGAEPNASRHVSVTDLGEILGPTADKGIKMLGAFEHLAIGQLTGRDVHNVRAGILPLQNLWGLRRLIDEGERGLSSALGLRPYRGEAWRPAP